MPYDKVELERRGVSFGPPPAAFDVSAPSFHDRDPRALSDRGVCFWLSHSQTDLTTPDKLFTHRSVRQATGDEGLQTVARLDVDFDPQYERITLNAVRIYRSGQVRDALDPALIDLLQREVNLERAIYDGRQTMHVVVPDVRVDDVVEFIYTISGANPVLRGAFAWWFVLQWSVPVVETRAVLRVASDRNLVIRKLASAPDPVRTTADDLVTLTWRAVDVEPYRQQDGNPLAFVGFQAVHVADALSWSGVADIFRDAYDVSSPLPADLADLVANIRDAHPEPGQRMVEGLRLVQGLLRYHSVGIGEGGYRPRAIDQIWMTRYGDCKDGSRLLAAVLRALGIDAVCALVTTQYGADLDQTPPNAQAFDHCIVRARIESRTYWLDATRSVQAGSPETITQDDYDWALPLEPDARLEAMNPQPILMVCEITERWTFALDQKAPARLELVTIYRGWRADGIRRWLANDGPASVERQWREGLEQELHSPLAVLEQPRIDDEAQANVLKVTETYEVAKPLQLGSAATQRFVSRDDIVGAHVKTMAPGLRVEPYQLGLPRQVMTTRIFEFPVPIAIAPWSETIDGPAQRLTTSLAWETPTTAVHRLSYTVRSRTLAAGEADAYREFVAMARQNNGIAFDVPFDRGRMKAFSDGPGWRSWTIVVGCIAAWVLWRWFSG